MAEKKTSNNNSSPPVRSKGPGRFINFYLIITAFLVFQLFNINTFQPKELTWKSFSDHVVAVDAVERVVIVNKEKAEVYIKKESREQGYFTEIPKEQLGPHFFFMFGSVGSIMDEWSTYGLETNDVRYITRTNELRNALSWALPFLIIIGVWIFIFRSKIQLSALLNAIAL